jgi:hypothetical protein
VSWPCHNPAARRRMLFGLRDASQAEENTRQDLRERPAWAHVASRPGEIKLAVSSDGREIRWSVRGAKCTNAAEAVSRIS